MAAKPTPGGSDGTYGTELNEFLDVSLASDGKVKTEALQTDSTAPVADAAVANKKYVDDQDAALEIKDITGHFDSGSWDACSAGTTATITHNLNSTLVNIVILFTVNSNGNLPTRLGWINGSGVESGALIEAIGPNAFQLQFAQDNAGYTAGSSGNTVVHSTGFYRILVTRIQ